MTPLALACALLCWASAFPGVRLGLRTFAPGHLALGRFLVASLALGLWVLATGARLPARRDWPLAALCGLLGFTIYNATFNIASTRVTAGTAAFMIHISPILAMLWARLWLGEQIPARVWPSVALSLTGVVLLALGESPHDVSGHGVSGEGFQFNGYTLLLLVTALSASFYTVLQKRLLARCDAMGLIAASVWCGTLFLMVFAPGFLGALCDAPWSALGVMVYLGVFPGALSYAIWTWVLSRLAVATVVSFLYLVAPLATLIAWLWLGEVPPPLALLGGVLALSGVVLANAAKRGNVETS